MAAGGSTTVVLIAMGANFGIACAKFAAAAWTGSSAMASEAIHSLVDTSNQGLLLYGLHRARQPADEQHPFGYSKELYFWSFVVAIVLFALGAGVSIYEGVEKIRDPHPIHDVHIIYAVLGVAILLEGFSTYKAIAEFNRRYAGTRWFDALRQSKDPALFAIVLEDIAAMIGLTVALIGVAVADFYGIVEADGVASIAIGLVLAGVAVFMALEIKSLIIGEAVDAGVLAGIRAKIEQEIGKGEPITAINEIRTMHLGPEDVLVAASVDFRDGETARSVETTTAHLENVIKAEFPQVRRLFLEVQSQAAHREALAAEARHHAKVEGLGADDAVHVATLMGRGVDVSPASSNKPTVSAGVSKSQPAGQVADQTKREAPSANAPAERAKLDLASRPKSRKARKKARKT